MTRSIDLNPKFHKIISDILYEYAPEREVLVFGSRARWTAKDKSDLDLCIMGGEPLSTRAINALIDALEESPIPFKVDVVEWAKVESGFKEIIRRDGLPFEWPQLSLSVVTEINPDTIAKKNEPEFIRYVDISSVGIGQLNEPPKTMAFSDAPSRARRLVKQDDVVISSVRPNRKSRFYVTRELSDVVVSTGFAVIRPNRELIDPAYLYSLICSDDFVNYLVRNEKGAAYPAVTQDIIGAYTFTLPPQKIQKATADIVSPINQKIELNQRMNETLEAMGRALFKSWFVDYDPVRAKAEGSKPKGMDAATAALFPSAFSDEGLPEGWSIKDVSEVIDLNPTEKLSKGSVAPYLDMAALPTQGCWPDLPIRRKFSSGSKFKNGDTLLARITPCLENGKTAYIDYLEGAQICWGSTEFIVMRAKRPMPSEYVYLLARDNSFREHAIKSMTGTSGRQRVQTDSLGRFKVCVPSEEVAQKFAEAIKPLFAQIKANNLQQNTLSQIRDTLLPKLISGDLLKSNAISEKKKVAG